MGNSTNLDEAADALRRHYGGKGVEAGRDEGLDLMANAIRQELGIQKQEADDLVRQLASQERVQWIPRGVAPTTPDTATTQVVPGAAAHHDQKVTADTGARGYWKV
jgi:hypothetical protein